MYRTLLALFTLSLFCSSAHAFEVEEEAPKPIRNWTYTLEGCYKDCDDYTDISTEEGQDLLCQCYSKCWDRFNNHPPVKIPQSVRDYWNSRE